MFRAEIEKSQQLLKITFSDHVRPMDAKTCLESLQTLLGQMQPGFTLLTDLSGVESMPTSTVTYIGRIMELCTQNGVDTVIRVLPKESRNDIGFAIISQFHYGHHVQIVTCETLEEAQRHLHE